jgi:hypothetical protein
MAPARWTTDDETLFLQGHVAGFLEAQKNGRVKRFHVDTGELWFSKFPERDRVFPDLEAHPHTLSDKENEVLGAAIKTRRGVCFYHFRCHTESNFHTDSKSRVGFLTTPRTRLENPTAPRSLNSPL